MHLLAADYRDIGPFDGDRTVIFQSHAALIQAPVGSGKSFLFFDGIVYGLYKYSSRPLLRHQAESGAVSILREQRDGTYLVRRTLTHGKTKDRSQSTLYRVGGEIYNRLQTEYSDTILHADHSLRDTLSQSSIILEEIPTKTDTELQAILDDMLPPRSVLTNTQLLLQDSDNLFTMSPADRITVFQHLFNLLDIDAAKDLISEAKRETQTRIRILSDTSRQQTKYRELIASIVAEVTKGAQGAKGTKMFASLFFSRLEPIGDVANLAIEQTTLPSGWEEAIQSDIIAVSSSLEALQVQYAQREQQSKTLAESQKQLTTFESQSQSLDRQITQLQQSLQSLDQQALQHAEQTKKKAQKTYDTMITTIDRSGITTTLTTWVGQIEGLSLDPLTDQDPAGLQRIIDTLIAYGRELRTVQESEKKLIEQAEAQRAKDLAQTEKLIQTSITQRDARQRQIHDIENQIQKIQSDTKKSEKVSCPHCGEDISSLCHHADSQQEVVTALEKQKQSCATELKTIEQSLVEYQKQLKTVESSSKYQRPKTNNQDHIDELGQTMQAIGWKALQTSIDALQQQKKFIDQTTKAYDILRQQEDSLQSKQLELTRFQTQKESLTVQITDLQKIITKQEKQLATKPDPQLLYMTKEQLASLQQIQTSMQRLTELHTDLYQQIFQRKDLEIRDQRLRNLQHILSKELMYIVLETALPSLFSIINALLAQVVEYQLHFALVKNSSDRLELEVEVEDSRGRRSISSLSGGQKVILKLARILAVASYMRLPLLLLDETINNLDVDLIGRVAELIDDVIRKQDMTLYVVTHNPHIQQMSVWEEVVAVR